MPEPSNQVSLTVFPFENLSQEAQFDIFCRSFTTDLATELSRFRQFQVLSIPTRADTIAFVPEHLKQPDSGYIIDGTFRCEKEVIRLNVQLHNRETQHLVWGNRIQGKLNTLAEMQEHLLTEVVGALQQQINYDLLSSIKKKPKINFGAYQHWLFGMEELKKGSPENDTAARKHFEKALQLQPEYSLAYVGISLSYFNEWSCQLWDRWELCKSGAFDWAQKAIELDDQNYIAALVLGKIFLFDRSFETAEYYLRKSLLLNPNDPDTLIKIAAYFVFLDLKPEALQLYERSLGLNPFRLMSYQSVGSFIYFELGEFEKAASLVMASYNEKWADTDAFNAAIFHYLNEPEKTQAYWQKFLTNYQHVVKHGDPFTEKQAIDWLFQVNPFRGATNLKPFLESIANTSLDPATSPLKKSTAPQGNNVFAKETGAWNLCYEGVSVQLPEVKGFHDLKQLLEQPRELFHCTQLMGSKLIAAGEKLFDKKAKLHYQKKITDLQDQIREAEAFGKLARYEKLQEEYEELIDHITQSVGLRKKVRQKGSIVEKARSAVTWRIRHAIAKIEQQHPALGAHLSNAVTTGTFCSYKPDRELQWQLG